MGIGPYRPCFYHGHMTRNQGAFILHWLAFAPFLMAASIAFSPVPPEKYTDMRFMSNREPSLFSQNGGFQDISKTGTDAVILLHGLARSNRSMAKIDKALTHRGYTVINVDYQTTKFPIDFLAERCLPAAIKEIDRTFPQRIHFVTHSMGGILLRYYLKNHPLPNLGNVVMISPPNQGSELVDKLKSSFLFKKLNGPAGRQLGTDAHSLPNSLGPVDFHLGVIAGNRSLNPFYSWLIPGRDDGVVAVERTKITGMADFIILPHTHTFIMRSRDTIRQVIHFLENGKFDHPDGRGIE